jgi:hypothetical protein
MRYHLLALVTLAASHVACATAAIPVGPPPAPTCPEASTPPPPTAAPPAPATSAGATSLASPPPEPPPPPPALREALDAAAKAIAAGDAASADKQIAAAAASAGDDAHLAYLVAHLRATRFVYSGDLDRAADALLDVIPALAGHPELSDEFSAHNAMMMVREAQGDPAAALAEDDQATLCAARGTWGDPQARETLAFQKDRWHRAYLTRMLAESRTGSVKHALVAYARAALDEYRTRGFPDSVAVLDAYFAALDGKRGEALDAARRVDPAKDDDVEDLYLVVVGLEAGGDHPAAEAVRRVMRRAGGARVSRAIMLRWLDLDAKSRGFTPWHAEAH